MNPRIDERHDVLKDLDPYSFNILKPIIEDTSMHLLLRRNGLDLYIRRMGERSKGYISGLTRDRELTAMIFSSIAKYGELEQFAKSIVMNDLYLLNLKDPCLRIS